MSEVANSVDSTPTAQAPDLSALQEPNQNAATSAETLKPEQTASNGVQPQASGDNVPWHKDPRWQAWQREEKTLRETAGYGNIWRETLSRNPQFAQEVLAIIQRMSNGQQAARQQNREPLHPDPVVNAMMEKLQALEGKLKSGEEYLDQDRLEKSLGKYRGVFKTMVKDSDVLPEYQELFEQNVWKNLVNLNPDIQHSYAFDEESFRRAVESEMERYKKLTNGIISGYTSSKMKTGFPQTQMGGSPVVNAPTRTEAQEDAEFAAAIKAMAGG